MASRKRITQGVKIVIDAVASESGDSQPVQFLRDLNKDKKTKAWAARLFAYFQMLGDEGRITNKEIFKKLNDVVWEFRAGAARMLGGYLPGGIFLLTNGFRKKSQKTPQKQITIAEETLKRERKTEEGSDNE